MLQETLSLSNGYSAVVTPVIYAENPWHTALNPIPILVYNLNRRADTLDHYNTYLNLRDLYWAIPLSAFQTGKQRKHLLSLLKVDPTDYLQLMHQYCGSVATRAQEVISHFLPESPCGWSNALHYFNLLEHFAQLAGIPCLQQESTGHCQGDNALVFVAALPEFQRNSGFNQNDAFPADALQEDIDLWSAWAWDDIAQIERIIRPDGSRVPDEDNGPYYGADHAQSGLLTAAEDLVQQDIAYLQTEEAAAFDAACRDIATAA